MPDAMEALMPVISVLSKVTASLSCLVFSVIASICWVLAWKADVIFVRAAASASLPDIVMVAERSGVDRQICEKRTL